MTYEDVYKKATEVINEESILDYRPAVFETDEDTMLAGICACIPNTIMIWLKNGDHIWFRATER